MGCDTSDVTAFDRSIINLVSPLTSRSTYGCNAWPDTRLIMLIILRRYLDLLLRPVPGRHCRSPPCRCLPWQVNVWGRGGLSPGER